MVLEDTFIHEETLKSQFSEEAQSKKVNIEKNKKNVCIYHISMKETYVIFHTLEKSPSGSLRAD